MVIVSQLQHRKRLNENQLRLLGLICKFRFVTVPFISAWRNKNKSTVYERLLVLVDQGYLHKSYDKSWKLLGKPAIYSLAAKGIKALRDNTDYFSEVVYKNQYKNKSASRQLVDRSLDIADLCLRLNQQYGATLELFSKAEIARFEEFIRPLPDIYLRTASKKEGELQHYQLEIIEAGTFTWMIRKRINAHQEWLDEDWSFNRNYPTLLLICDNSNTERRIHRLTDEGYGDFKTWTTTRQRFDSGQKRIWLQYDDADEEIDLTSLC